ncbi:MAG: response regulator, partial [Bacteroidales bacterium]|nr:response regulator [Bacteroidales bacterium]
VVTARSGPDAIRKINTDGSFDIVLLDMQMPEMNGIEVTREIKKLKANLPIIAQTAFVFEDDKDIILEAGCDACLVKPIRKEQLISIMGSFI